MADRPRPPGHAASAVTDGLTGLTYPCCRCGWRSDPIPAMGEDALARRITAAYAAHAREAGVA